MNPVDVAKAADGAVLARLVWNWHDHIGCYLTLDGEAVEALRAAHAAANAPDPTANPEGGSGELPESISGWMFASGENDDGAWRSYGRFADPSNSESSPGIAGVCYADNTSFLITIWSNTPVSRSEDDESVVVSIDLGGVSGEERWRATEDDEYMLLFAGSGFVNELLAAGPVTLSLDIFDADGRSQSLEFDMTGFDAVIETLSQMCPVPLVDTPTPVAAEPTLVVSPSSVKTQGVYTFSVSSSGFTVRSANLAVCSTGDPNVDWGQTTLLEHCGGFGKALTADQNGVFTTTVSKLAVGSDGVTFLLFELKPDGEAAVYSIVPDEPAAAVITVPASEPSGRCASAVPSGVYQWEQCAWAEYWEDTGYNYSLSDGEAAALIARIWAEVDVKGKPDSPPTNALIPAGSLCATATVEGFIIGCYQPSLHHIRRLDAFLQTLLHEVAHALVTNHPTVTACRGITDNDPYQACVHNDIFRCVADHLYFSYAGIPNAGVCGTSGSGSQVNSWTAGENNWGFFAGVDADWHTRPSPYDNSDVRLIVRCNTDNELDVYFLFADNEGRITGNSNDRVQTSHVFLPDGYSEWSSDRQSEHIDSHRVDTNWFPSTTNNAAFLPEVFIQDFVNAAAINQSVLIRAQIRTDTDPVFMSFPLNGAPMHIQSVTQRCGWADGKPPADTACRPVGSTDDPFNPSSRCRVSGTNWYRDDTSETDALTGSTTTRIVSYVFTRETEYEPPYGDKHTTLNVRCTNDRFEVVVWFNRFIGTSRQIQISYRFDDTGPVRNENWNDSTSHEAAFSPNPRGFAQTLAESSKLVLRGWDSGNRVIGTLTFRTTGANNEVKRVMSACGLG